MTYRIRISSRNPRWPDYDDGNGNRRGRRLRSRRPVPWLADWHLASTASVNALLIAADGDTARILEEVRPYCRPPVTIWRPGERLVLPWLTQGGTLILQDISALTPEDQYRLLEWLSAFPACSQVVSASSKPLTALVESGLFLDTLYYRLNVVCAKVGGRKRKHGEAGWH